jgi:hypothetical protein
MWIALFLKRAVSERSDPQHLLHFRPRNPLGENLIMSPSNGFLREAPHGD